MTNDPEALKVARECAAATFTKLNYGRIYIDQVLDGERDDIAEVQSALLAYNRGLRAGAEAERRRVGYQARVGQWITETFDADTCSNQIERAMRFLEESLELCQALGMTHLEVVKVAEYVYGRPVGVPEQEVGGVCVTLAALCHVVGIDEAAEAERELARIDTPEMKAKIAAKQVSKRLFGMTHRELRPTIRQAAREKQ